MVTLHQIVGYLLLLGAGIGLLWSAYQYSQRHPFGDTDQALADVFLAGLYLELFLGLLLFMLNPESVTAIPAHPILAVIAVGLAQWGRKPRRRSKLDPQLFKAAVYLFAGLLILVGILVGG